MFFNRHRVVLSGSNTYGWVIWIDPRDGHELFGFRSKTGLNFMKFFFREKPLSKHLIFCNLCSHWLYCRNIFWVRTWSWVPVKFFFVVKFGSRSFLFTSKGWYGSVMTPFSSRKRGIGRLFLVLSIKITHSRDRRWHGTHLVVSLRSTWILKHISFVFLEEASSCCHRFGTLFFIKNNTLWFPRHWWHCLLCTGCCCSEITISRTVSSPPWVLNFTERILL